MASLLYNIYMILLFFAGISAAGQPVSDMAGLQSGREDRTTYADAMKFEDRELSKNGDDVTLSMKIILDSTRIRTQHTITLTPVLISADSTEECDFGAVIIDGRARHRVFLRKEALEKEADSVRNSAIAVIMRKNGSAQEYTYMSSVPYHRWMLGGRVELRESVSGCAECGEGTSEHVMEDPVLQEFIPVWKTSRIAPEPEPVKRRQEHRIARIQYRWDRYDILPSWADNKAVLDTVTKSVAIVKDRDYITITGIYVAGFTSPEGTYEYNMKLSNRRARTFADYISGNTDVDRSLLTVEWSGEDWEGLKAALAGSDFRKKAIVTGIIDTYTEDRNECERQMRAILTEEEYRWLVDNIYPGLRHCTYRIEYEVRNFDIEEARRMVYERPQDLNLDEIYKVAGSYPAGSKEYEDAMAVAAVYFPDSPAVLGDLALDALEEGNAGKAIAVLRGVEYRSLDGQADPASGKTVSAEDAALLNILGVAYARSSDYEMAGRILGMASEAGNADAAHNLLQVAGVVDQLEPETRQEKHIEQ